MKRSGVSILGLLTSVLAVLVLVLAGVIYYILFQYHHIADMKKTLGKNWHQLETQLNQRQRLLTELIEKTQVNKIQEQSLSKMKKELKDIETIVNQKGKHYNQMAKDFNRTLERFPGKIIAGWSKIKKADLFNGRLESLSK